VPGVYDRVRAIGGALMSGLADLVKRLGITAQVVGHPTCFDVFFTDTPIVDYRATLTNDIARLRRFNAACLKRGVLKGVTKIYVSCAHTEADVERTLAVFEAALETVG
jgi:glutamate-1-semialdehyde 2,1-aminomutase